MSVVLCVAGPRDYNNWHSVMTHMDLMYPDGDGIRRVITGGATGVDRLAERWANSHGLDVVKYYPDWTQHGRAAGPLRNRAMARDADHVVAFWDWKSRGTLSMINEALKNDTITSLRIVRVWNLSYEECNDDDFSGPDQDAA